MKLNGKPIDILQNKPVIDIDLPPPHYKDEFEMIDQVYTEEKKQLCELEERFKTLETEYISIQEERTIERNKRELEDQKMKTKQKAVTTIQAFWRSYKVSVISVHIRGHAQGH